MTTARKNSAYFLDEGDDTVVDIRDYSVHPGSGNDETAGIQKALDDLPQGPFERYDRPIYFPMENGKNEYIISTITPKGRGLKIVGDAIPFTVGNRAGSHFTSDGTGTHMFRGVVSEMGLSLTTGGLNGLTIMNMGFKGNNTSGGPAGILLNPNPSASSGVLIENCNFWQIETCIETWSLFSSTFRNILMDDLFGMGFRCVSGGLDFLHENVWINNGGQWSMSHGWLLESGEHTLLNCNGIDSVSFNKSWMVIDGDTHVILTGNTNIENPGGFDAASNGRGAIEVKGSAEGAKLSLIGARIYIPDHTGYRLFDVEATDFELFIDEASWLNKGGTGGLEQQEGEDILGRFQSGNKIKVNAPTMRNISISIANRNHRVSVEDVVDNLNEITQLGSPVAFKSVWVKDLSRTGEDQTPQALDSITKDTPSTDTHRVALEAGESHGLVAGSVVKLAGTPSGDWDGVYECVLPVDAETFDIRWTGATASSEASNMAGTAQRIGDSSYSGGYIYYDDDNSTWHRFEDHNQVGPVKT